MPENPAGAGRAARRRCRRRPARQPQGQRPVHGRAGRLQGAAEELTQDPPGAVVVTGGEQIFAAGADISEFGGPDEARRGRRRLPPRPRRPGRHAPGGHGGGHRVRPGRRVRAGPGLRPAHRLVAGQVRPARDPARDHPRRRGHPAPGPARRRVPGQGPDPHRPPGRGRGGPAHRAWSTRWSSPARSPTGPWRWPPSSPPAPLLAQAYAKRRSTRASTARWPRAWRSSSGCSRRSFATEDAEIGVQSFLDNGPGHATFTGH